MRGKPAFYTPCQWCKKLFLTKPSLQKKGQGRFCSLKCYSLYCTDQMPARKCKTCNGIFRRYYGKYCSNKCQHKALKRFTEEKANNWKGDRVGYRGLHYWVYKHLGRPNKCEHCGLSDSNLRKFHWANKSHEYKRDLADWIRLCVKCHRIYDKK